MNREQVHAHATFHGFLGNHIYVHSMFSKNFVSIPHSWPWHEHRCTFSSCPYPPHSALLLERVIQWVNHYINTLSHKDFPWLGHGTDFFKIFEPGLRSELSICQIFSLCSRDSRKAPKKSSGARYTIKKKDPTSFFQLNRIHVTNRAKTVFDKALKQRKGIKWHRCEFVMVLLCHGFILFE